MRDESFPFARLSRLEDRHLKLMMGLYKLLGNDRRVNAALRALSKLCLWTLSKTQRVVKEAIALGYISIVGRSTRFGSFIYQVAPYLMPKRAPVVNQSPSSRTKEERDSESVSTTESVAARAKEGFEKINPSIPRSDEDKERARRGWLGWLGEYCRDCEPKLLMKFFEEALKPASLARPFLNELTRRAKVTGWYRARCTALAEGRRWCREGAASSPPPARALVSSSDRAARQRAVWEESKKRPLVPLPQRAVA